MRVKQMIVDFAVIFCVTLVVSSIVTFLYSLLVHGTGQVDWGASFRLALIIGIVLPATGRRGQRADRSEDDAGLNGDADMAS